MYRNKLKLTKRERLYQKFDNWTRDFGVEKAFLAFLLLWTLVFLTSLR